MCTAIVCPTKSGVINEARDQVFITDLLFYSTLATIFFSRLWCTKGPFFNERPIVSYFFLRSIINLLLALVLERVLNPLAGIPLRLRGCPPDARPSPPPIG